jgi:hypothetical protein
MALIDNAAQAPKMYVVQVLAVIAALQAVWTQLPAEVMAYIPPNFVHYATAGLALLGVVARVIKQFDAPFAPTEPQK